MQEYFNGDKVRLKSNGKTGTVMGYGMATVTGFTEQQQRYSVLPDDISARDKTREDGCRSVVPDNLELVQKAIKTPEGHIVLEVETDEGFIIRGGQYVGSRKEPLGILKRLLGLSA